MRDVVTWSLLLKCHTIINCKGGISILCLKDTMQRHSHLYRCGRWEMQTCLRCLIEAKKSLCELFDIVNEEYQPYKHAEKLAITCEIPNTLQGSTCKGIKFLHEFAVITTV